MEARLTLKDGERCGHPAGQQQDGKEFHGSGGSRTGQDGAADKEALGTWSLGPGPRLKDLTSCALLWLKDLMISLEPVSGSLPRRKSGSCPEAAINGLDIRKTSGC